MRTRDNDLGHKNTQPLFKTDVCNDLAIELLHRQVAVICTSGSENVTRAAMAMTTTIPIVAMVAGDPVKRGLVTSVDQPSANVAMIRTTSNSWNPIITAPTDVELELCVREDEEYHILAFP